MNGIPENLDWVTRRNNCSVAAVFEMLKAQIEGDVNTRTEQLNALPNAPYRIGVVRDRGMFTVFGESLHGENRRAITFVATQWSIVIRDEDEDVLLEAIPTVCDDGKCRLKVDGQERELWHVRKMALEDLFFHFQ